MMIDEGKGGPTGGGTIEIQPRTEPAGPNSESINSSGGREEAGPSNRKRSVHFKLFGADILGETEEDDDDDQRPEAKAIRTENKESPYIRQVTRYCWSDDGRGNKEKPYRCTPMFFSQSPPPFIEYLPLKPRPATSSIDYHPETSGGGEISGWDFRLSQSAGPELPRRLVEFLPPKDYSEKLSHGDSCIVSPKHVTHDFLGEGCKYRPFGAKSFCNVSPLFSGIPHPKRCVTPPKVDPAVKQCVDEDSDGGYDSESGSNSTPPAKVC